MTLTDNDEAGKLFVGGLSWETTQEILQSYFSKFGEVVDSVVMKNNETGRSRGFGFVTFKDPSCVSIVLQTKPHELNGRIVDAKECTPRSLAKNRKGPNQGKVFLGGLPPDITETDIRSSLARYGKVSQVSIMCDQETKKCRGFGFISFESEDGIDKACAERFVIINGKQVECKRAEPRENSRKNQFGGSQNGGPSGAYGGGPGYQGNWNQAPQQFGMQGGNSYGGYQAYGAPAATPYGQSAMPYNPTPPAAQYQQQPYGNYGGMGYGYPQAAAPAGNNWPSAPTPGAAAGYGQQPGSAAPGYPPAPGMSNEAKPSQAGGSYGAPNAYQQVNSTYGPTKSYGGAGGGYQKQNAGNGGGGYNQNSSPSGRGGGQGYHPYRR